MEKLSPRQDGGPTAEVPEVAPAGAYEKWQALLARAELLLPLMEQKLATAAAGAAATTSVEECKNLINPYGNAIPRGWIYVLLCKENKIYVGRTTKDPMMRFFEHIQHFHAGYGGPPGAQWTLVYEPLEVLAVYPMYTPFCENNYVIEWMLKRKPENVRGGTFSAVVLPVYQIRTLQDILRSHTNTCFACGGTGHYSVSCPAKAKAKVVPAQVVSDDKTTK